MGPAGAHWRCDPSDRPLACHSAGETDVKIRFLGTHQGESREGRFVSLLIDGTLAIDAGGLAGALSLGEQTKLQALLLTHYHLDHIKDVPTVGFNRMQVDALPLPVYAAPEVQRVLLAHLLNGVIWPDLTQRPSAGSPALRFHTVEDSRPFGVLDYTVLPMSTRHPVPTLGFQIASAEGKSVFYTADTGPAGDLWGRISPDLLITEVTLSNDQEEVAVRAGHLTANLLHAELARFRALHGYLPRVRAVHVNPYQENGIRGELAIVAQDLGAEIELAAEDSVVEV